MSKIRLCNHKGDEVIATFDPTDTASVKVAQDELTKFLGDCITRYGSEPPVFAKRIGDNRFTPFNRKSDDLAQVADMVLQFPLVGG